MVEDLLTEDDWEKLKSLKIAISENPASVATHKMEQFTDLLVKSLYGKGNGVNFDGPTNY